MSSPGGQPAAPTAPTAAEPAAFCVDEVDAVRPFELGAPGFAGTPIFCAAAKYAAEYAADMAGRKGEKTSQTQATSRVGTADNL